MKQKDIQVLGSGVKLISKRVGKISWSPVPGLLYISIPEEVFDKYVTVIKLSLNGPVRLYRVMVDLINYIPFIPILKDRKSYIN